MQASTARNGSVFEGAATTLTILFSSMRFVKGVWILTTQKPFECLLYYKMLKIMERGQLQWQCYCLLPKQPNFRLRRKKEQSLNHD